MTSESPHDDTAVTAGLPEQRNAQPSEAVEAALPRQSDGGSGARAPAEKAATEAEQAEAERSEAEQAEGTGLEDAGLSDRDRAVLAFEKQHFKYSGSKEQAIRDRFGMSATRYYQVLNALLDRPEALEFDPMVVNRLRRRRAVRQRARSSHPEA